MNFGIYLLFIWSLYSLLLSVNAFQVKSGSRMGQTRWRATEPAARLHLLKTEVDQTDKFINELDKESMKQVKTSNVVQKDGEGSIFSGVGKFVLLAFGFVASVASVGALESGVDINSLLKNAADSIQNMGPMGYIYFGVLYTVAEILAIPATPLTASSGYLFGLVPGVMVVLISATIAAAVSFAIGRSILRDWAEELAVKNAKWRAIDRAISKDAFKVVLLLRLSPLLPFALSNYLYALTSIRFWPFLWATFLGFAPGTFGIVYAGTAGKALLGGGDGGVPWYVYTVGAALVGFFAQTIGKIASDAIQEMEMEDEMNASGM